ncbi:MAG: thiamine pyrophosphate-binding protein [Oscillospiraceae bacterium]|nr:thiamine pyrophosphate-binding protein [Oscillospiraceae bacterium]
MINCAEYIIRFFHEKGIDTVFDYPGNAVIELYRAMRSEGGISGVTVRHEQGAVHAAAGYAKASGRVGVCIATSGPGAANLVTGLCDAMLDSVPLIAITGQVDRASVGHDAFQESDITGITIPVTKHNFLLKSPDMLPTVLDEAYTIATSGRPGPVLIDIPKDILGSESRGEPHPVLPHKRTYKNALPDMKDRVVSLMNGCFRPIILCGGGVVSAGGSDAMKRFSDINAIPVTYTMMGKSAYCGISPLLLGMAGIHGDTDANMALAKADLVLAVGCRFSDRTCPDPERFTDNKIVIHADIDAAELNKNVFSICPVVSDARDFFEFLESAEFSEEKRSAWGHWSEKLSKKRQTSDAYEETDEEENKMTAYMRKLMNVAGDAVIITDVGEHQLIAAREFTPMSPRSFISSGGLGTMGFGLPAAIGVYEAMRNDIRQRPVVLITGDGSFQMCIQELGTLKQRNSPLKIFLFDNSSLELVEKYNRKLYPGSSELFPERFFPDMSFLCASYGIKYIPAGVISGFENICREAFGFPSASIVHIKI